MTLGTSAIALALLWWTSPYDKRVMWMAKADGVLILLEAWCLCTVAVIPFIADYVDQHLPTGVADSIPCSLTATATAASVSAWLLPCSSSSAGVSLCSIEDVQGQQCCCRRHCSWRVGCQRHWAVRVLRMDGRSLLSSSAVRICLLAVAWRFRFWVIHSLVWRAFAAVRAVGCCCSPAAAKAPVKPVAPAPAAPATVASTPSMPSQRSSRKKKSQPSPGGNELTAARPSSTTAEMAGPGAGTSVNSGSGAAVASLPVRLS